MQQEELHERIAALEVYFLLSDSSATHRAVYIEEENGLGNFDERRSLSEKDRRKVNEFLPDMVAKGKSEVERIAKGYFNIGGWTQYIGVMQIEFSCPI